MPIEATATTRTDPLPPVMFAEPSAHVQEKAEALVASLHPVRFLAYRVEGEDLWTVGQVWSTNPQTPGWYVTGYDWSGRTFCGCEAGMHGKRVCSHVTAFRLIHEQWLKDHGNAQPSRYFDYGTTSPMRMEMSR